MKKIFLLIIILGNCLFAQIGNPVEESKKFSLSNFYLEALSNKSTEPGKTRLDVYLQVPFSSVQFVRNENSFTAFYTVTITVFDEGKENIFYDQNWVERLKAESFEDANSPFSSNYSQKSVDLKPGKYTLFCSIEDGDSKKLSFSEALINIRAFTDTLELSDALVIDQIIKDKGAEQLIPNVSRTVTTDLKEMPFYFEVYSEKKQTYSIEYTLKDKKGELLYNQSEEKSLNAGINKILYTFKNPKFHLGNIEIGITLKKDGKEVKNYIKIVNGRIAGLPISIDNIDDAIDQMAYITSGENISFIRNTQNADEKIKKFFDFWDTKKPSAAIEENHLMKEYYKRVDYSNRHFKGVPSGWKSDMGMVYIILGPPETVERQPMPANSNPYEIWSYPRLNRQYVFYDPNGFGSYKLQNPDYDLLNGAGIR
jgi:GWxTD domain-containing protein